jgi:DNA-binding beta-propeller fold protein YncE
MKQQRTSARMLGLHRATFAIRFLLGFVIVCSPVTILQGCGSSSSSSTGTTTTIPTLQTPTVTVTPAASSATTAQSVPVAIAVSGSAGTIPAGSVKLTSGSYGSFSSTLSNGAATIVIPAGLLVAGGDTLMATYTPSSASSPVYNSGSGTASISISATAGTITVAASAVTYPTNGAPFQAIVSPSGTVFVGVSNGVQVFTPSGGGLTSSCTNALSSTLLSEGGSVSELSYLPNGTDIAAGISSPGAIFYNAAALQSCTATGYVTSQGSIASDQGSQAVAVTPDGKYAFVSNEYGVASGATTEGNIGVVSLQYDSNGNVNGGTLLGQISTGGQAIAGMLLSPDGTRLYVTSEIAGSASQGAGSSNPVLARTGCVQQSGGATNINGILTVINVASAETSPGTGAILATVDAGCSPVRMAETANGAILWVAVRGDNRVLAFSTGMLELTPGNALLGYAATGGTAPVGIALLDGDNLLSVANSNRFNTGTANATILDVAYPPAATVVQTISTGLFPREITTGPDNATLYLTNYDSDTLEVISTH